MGVYPKLQENVCYRLGTLLRSLDLSDVQKKYDTTLKKRLYAKKVQRFGDVLQYLTLQQAEVLYTYFLRRSRAAQLHRVRPKKVGNECKWQ